MLSCPLESNVQPLVYALHNRAVETNKFVIPKILIENLIDDGFSVKEMSNILCVSKSTVLRRMMEYGLKVKDFSNISDDQLDSHVLALTNHNPFCSETILRELLKGRGIIIQGYRFRDSMHRVSEAGIQSRRKGRLKRRVYNQKEQITSGILALTINLSSGT